MRSSLRKLLSEFLGTWMYLTLGGLGILTSPFLPPVTWAVSLVAGSLAGGDGAHLSPSVSIGLTVIGKSSWWSLPGCLAGQFLGSFVAGMTLVGIGPVDAVTRMSLATSNTSSLLTEPWFYGPVAGEGVYREILTLFLAALIFQLLICASSGSALYQGLALGTLIHAMGKHKGGALNPARQLMGRLLVSIYHQSFHVFTENDFWFWKPVVWSLAGSVCASLLYWLFIQVPLSLETSKTRDSKLEGEDVQSEISSLLEEKSQSIVQLSPTTRKSRDSSHSNHASATPGDTPLQLRALFREKPSRSSSILRYCKRNNISSDDLKKYLERYDSVRLDKLDLGNGVTVNVKHTGAPSNPQEEKHPKEDA